MVLTVLAALLLFTHCTLSDRKGNGTGEVPDSVSTADLIALSSVEKYTVNFSVSRQTVLGGITENGEQNDPAEETRTTVALAGHFDILVKDETYTARISDITAEINRNGTVSSLNSNIRPLEPYDVYDENLVLSVLQGKTFSFDINLSGEIQDFTGYDSITDEFDELLSANNAALARASLRELLPQEELVRLLFRSVGGIKSTDQDLSVEPEYTYYYTNTVPYPLIYNEICSYAGIETETSGTQNTQPAYRINIAAEISPGSESESPLSIYRYALTGSSAGKYLIYLSGDTLRSFDLTETLTGIRDTIGEENARTSITVNIYRSIKVSRG